MLNERNTLLEDDGIEEEILVEEECSVAQAVWGDILGNIENQTDLQNALDAKQDSLTEAQLNAVNSGITSEKVTTYDGYADQIASKADQSALNAESIARGEADTALGTRIDNEALARQQTDNGLQSQIDAITSKSDVVDVVANYAALQAYDTSTLGNNDVVKVLDDETHEDALTYYRWSTTTQTWSYIGQEAPYYSKGQMDVKLAEKQDKLTAGANIQIQNGTISATDTKYTNGNGLNLNGTEFSADTTVLATKTDLDSYYTKPEADNLLAPKLEAEVVAELPTTGDESKLYLTPKAHTTSTATGNPIDATVTEQAGQLESFQLDGDTFQQSYTGKNLLAITRTAETKNGVTCTWDGASFTLNGTSTASTDFYGRGWWGATSDPIALPAGTYTISLRKSDGSLATDANFSIDCYYGTTWIIGIYRGNSGAGYRTLTFDSDTQYSVFYISLMSGKTYNNEKFYVQLEKSESPTPYEPFVGGQPIPNPDYPQPIQTVTGEQTVEIEGKNKYPFNDTAWTSTATITTWCYQDGSTGAYGATVTDSTNYKLTLPAGTYTVTGYNLSDNLVRAQVVSNGESGETIWANGIQSNQLTQSFTLTEATTLCVRYRVNDPSLGIGNTKIQIESGTTSNTYAPYSKQTLPLNLGSIELCKLGTYQDYIYKDGDSWKVHKAAATITLDGSSDENWSKSNNVFFEYSDYSYVGDVGAGSTAFSTSFIYWPNTGGISNNMPNLQFGLPATKVGIGIRNDSIADTDALRTWLSTNVFKAYVSLAAATDTTITDTTLIAQLEAIRTASLQNGANTITNTATGSNLAGDMEIGYYGFNPRNRYDKWLWLDINNEYEQLNNPDTSSTLSTLSTRTLGTTTEQPTVTRSLETETITLKKGETEPIEDKTELPTILDEEAEETETTEPEESDGTDER